MTLSADKRSATWEPGAQIRGTAWEGDPPKGDFSPVGMAGTTYTPRDVDRADDAPDPDRDPGPAPSSTPTPTPTPRPT
jgi:hypothetical protein